MPEPTKWQERERDRLYGGPSTHWTATYTAPVWEGEEWWSEASHWIFGREAIKHHFVHVSSTNPLLFAYTENADKGARDIQTQIKPGRYLTKFFGDVLTAKQIAALADWQRTGTKGTAYDSDAAYPFALASTPEEISAVYVAGPQSCMKRFPKDDHPCRVYGAGDLAIAYLTKAGSDKPIARSLVWPERKVFGRVYPTPDCWSSDGFDSRAESEDIYTALTNRLRAEGYKADENHNGFNGARLLKIDLDAGGYVMPYLDHGYMVNHDGVHFTMAQHGGLECSNTDGTIENEDDRGYCENCEENCDADYMDSVYTRVGSRGGRGEQAWCQHCCENHTFYCHGFDETFSDNVEHVEIDGRDYTLEYASENFTYSDYSEEYFDGKAVEMQNGETWSADEFDNHGFKCLVTGENHPNEDMHPDHPGIHEDVSDDDIAAYLAEARITDDTQTELDLAA